MNCFFNSNLTPNLLYFLGDRNRINQNYSWSASCYAYLSTAHFLSGWNTSGWISLYSTAEKKRNGDEPSNFWIYMQKYYETDMRSSKIHLRIQWMSQIHSVLILIDADMTKFYTSTLFCMSFVALTYTLTAK